MTDTSQSSVTPPDDDGFTFVDFMTVLARRGRLVLGLPFAVALISVVVSLLLPVYYTSTIRILPPQQGMSGAAAMFAQIAGSIGNPGGLTAGIRNPNDLYVSMLKSRTVADNLIKQFELANVYGQTVSESLRARLDYHSIISTAKDGTILVAFEDTDPKRAADIANAYMDELHKLTRVLAVTQSSQQRLFFERELAEAKKSLAAVEASAQLQLVQGGVVKVDDQGRAMIMANAQMRAKIVAQNVQIYAMRTFASENNPDLKLAMRELESLQRELAKIEGGSGAKSGDNVVNGKGADSLSLLRNVKYFETLYEQLAKQYEYARIEEARDASIVQILDKAIPAELKSRPKRAQIVIFSTLIAFAMSVLVALFLETLARAASDPRQSARLNELKGYLSLRRKAMSR